MQDVEGYTALARATSSGDFQMIQCMIDKNPKLVSIPEKSVGSILVVISMCFDSKELSHYLYLRTPLMDLEPEKGHQGASLISFAIYTLTLDREQRSPLYVLASKASLCFGSAGFTPSTLSPTKSKSTFGKLAWFDIVEKVFKQLSEMKLLHVQSQELLSRICKPISTLNAEARNNGGVYAAIFRAIKEGNFEFVYKIVRANPDLLYAIEYPTKRTIFMLAVLHRQAKIFSLIYELQQIKTSLSGSDSSYNNILHMAGIFTMSTPIQHIRGAALQMQRELQWFKISSLILHLS
ncbi:hypothetical protein CJ030_MR3G015859 [Morella rubra]|uniref:Uncharacterized protein n=1 Tax=Morella rubra TaxID=262757 RepID=A0A6A1W8F6_9ROSI|nr:hypothetical protein CJ030_MR3G015859 [Morella rubra]